MRDYTVHYNNGDSKQLEVADKKELIEILFSGDEQKFKSEVKLLKWKTADMFYTEEVDTGKVSSALHTADANPYGWRNEGDLPHEE